MENPYRLLIVIITTLVIMILVFYRAESKRYTVGDGEGWDIGTNYMAWAQPHNFTVGDVLVFKYVKGQHNAYQVSKEVYRSCDVGNGSASAGVLKKYETGSDEVVLGEARDYWFICSFQGHCLGGMKFGLNVTLDLIAPPNTTDDGVTNNVSNSGRGRGRGGGAENKKFWALWAVLLLANLALFFW